MVLALWLALPLTIVPFGFGGLPASAWAQRHPPELRGNYPVGGSAGATTRVTIAGMSLRNATQVLFDHPGITAKIAPQDMSKLPPPNLDTDGNPNIVADITVAKNVPPGAYRFRVVSPSGVTDAGTWMAGRALPQIEEKEPNNDISTAQAVTLPVAVNGHIDTQGDQDVFRVTLTAGQAFVADVQSNRAGLPLDSLLTLRDANGRELAGNDDHNGPDSLLVYTPTMTGSYLVTISSSDGQGTPSHAYRLEMGVLPLLNAIYPAGAQVGQHASWVAMGINLDASSSIAVSGNIADKPGIARAFVESALMGSNNMPVLLSSLPAVNEQEPNDTRLSATPLPIPCLANGRFWHTPKAGSRTPTPGENAPDVDCYKFRGEAGKRYVFDVVCQQLGSPADPALTLLGPDDKTIAENDDTNGRDSHIDVTLPTSGEYVVRVTEARGRSGPEYIYCLTAQTPAPGFTIAAETRERGVGQGNVVPLEVTVTRDRWEGPVTLGIRDLPPGVTASTCVVPPGATKGLLLLSADKAAPLAAFPLHVVATAQVQGATVQHTLESAVDWVWKGGPRANVTSPSDLLVYAVREPFEIAPIPAATSLSLLRGQSATLNVKLTRQPGYNKPVTLRVLGLPDGVTSADVAIPADKSEGVVELKATPTARLGAIPITVSCVVTQSQFIQLDRATPAITLTVTEPAKK